MEMMRRELDRRELYLPEWKGEGLPPPGLMLVRCYRVGWLPRVGRTPATPPGAYDSEAASDRQARHGSSTASSSRMDGLWDTECTGGTYPAFPVRPAYVPLGRTCPATGRRSLSAVPAAPLWAAQHLAASLRACRGL